MQTLLQTIQHFMGILHMMTKLLLRWLEFRPLPCDGSEMGRRLGFQIGTQQI